MDLLDAEGVRDDPFTGRPRSAPERAAYLAARDRVGWHRLPMYEGADGLAEALRSSQVTLLVAGTGAGKTVIAPRLAHAVLRGMGLRGRVAVSNPKRVTTEANARTAAYIVAAEPGGGSIGYRYRGSPEAAAGGQVLYATDGYLLSLSRGRGGLGGFDLLMIDEVHEHSLPTDFLLLQARREAQRRRSMRILVVTATIGLAEREAMLRWFRDGGLSACEVVVPGATPKPVDVLWRPCKDPARYVDEAAEHALRLAASTGGSVLVFVPTVADTRAGCASISRLCKGGKPGNEGCEALEEPGCVRLFSGSADEVEGRRGVFSTNVAESSITLRDLTAVVDTCLSYTCSYEPRCDATVGRVGRITRAQCIQRRGRVGRVAPGTCVHMITEAEFGKMPESPPPSVRSSDLSEQAWSLLEGLRTWDRVASEFAAMLLPPEDLRVEAARQRLVAMGLVASSAGTPSTAGAGAGAATETGRAVRLLQRRARVPSLSGACALLSALMSGDQGCVSSVAFLTAASQTVRGVDDLWLPRDGVAGRPGDMRASPSGDHLTLIADRSALAARDPVAIASANRQAWGAIERESARILDSLLGHEAPRLALRAGPWSLITHTGLVSALLVSRFPNLHIVGRDGIARRRLSKAAFPAPPGASTGDGILCDSVTVSSGACVQARPNMWTLVRRRDLELATAPGAPHRIDWGALPQRDGGAAEEEPGANAKPVANAKPAAGPKPGANAKPEAGPKPGANAKPEAGPKPGANAKPGRKPAAGPKPEAKAESGTSRAPRRRRRVGGVA
jgi:hypothetical protein